MAIWRTLTQWQTANNLGNLKPGDIMAATRSGATGGGVIPTDILDTNGNVIIGLTTVAAAVNYINITNASSSTVALGAAGTTTNINLQLSTAGTGIFSFVSTAPSSPFLIYNGTSSQHATVFSFANTANTRTVTFPDATGTICYDTGSANITTVGTIGTGTWQATVIGMTYGGTGANLTPSNGGIIYSNATTMAVLAGTATANKMLLSGSSTTPSWSTSTIPTSAGSTANKVLLSDGTNYVLSTPTFPNASATSGKRIKSDGTNWVASTTTMPDAGTSRKMIVGDGTNYVESTETWAVPGTSGNYLKSDGTNWTSVAFPFAVASDQETATSTTLAVTPAVQQRHPSAAKSWVKFTSVTTTSILASYNVTSLTDGGTGITTVNLTTSFSSTNYCALASPDDSASQSAQVGSLATGSYVVRTLVIAGPAFTDSIGYSATWGDQ